MHLLIIEDEAKTASYLHKGLTENGFNVDLAMNGQDGLHLATSVQYDLIILDVMLPKVDGWSIVTVIRERDKQIPILFLTACDAVNDRVKGLRLGADDYLVKPFSFAELNARIFSLLRRGQAQQVEVMKIADLQIDFLAHKVTRAGNRIDLTQKEFALLSLLMRRSGELLSRTMIAEQVWDMNFDSDTNIIDVAIRRLRRKVDEDFDKRLIHTVRGVGYVLEERHEKITVE